MIKPYSRIVARASTKLGRISPAQPRIIKTIPRRIARVDLLPSLFRKALILLLPQLGHHGNCSERDDLISLRMTKALVGSGTAVKYQVLPGSSEATIYVVTANQDGTLTTSGTKSIAVKIPTAIKSFAFSLLLFAAHLQYVLFVLKIPTYLRPGKLLQNYV